jgi:hypothetical protein
MRVCQFRSDEQSEIIIIRDRSVAEVDLLLKVFYVG